MDINIQFYDELAQDYHLIFDNWEAAINDQAKILDRLIKEHANNKVNSLLDCASGIGTQAIGLAQLGYNVAGTDLSSKAIERACKEAENFKVSIPFKVVDFRELKTKVTGRFDAVIACDNALPHLLNKTDMLSSLENINSKLETGGLFLASIRDYDAVLLSKPSSTSPTIKGIPDHRSISFQVWDWEPENIYTVNHFTLKEKEGVTNTFKRVTKYKAYTRQEITAYLESTGFTAVKWLMPDTSGYYQPVVVAIKS